MTLVLILGSGPNVTDCEDWDLSRFDAIVAINNAWRVRPDWTHHIHPEDFPEDKRPAPLAAGQRVITAQEYVPHQNRFGGFVYAGGTMAFTAGYWALSALKPRVIAMLGCDMTYEGSRTHFYGKGTADPLREDVTLRSLEAKAARLMLLAGREGCATVNLSTAPSRLVFPRASLASVADALPARGDGAAISDALGREESLDYRVPSGRYWQERDRFDIAQIDRLDALWLKAARLPDRVT